MRALLAAPPSVIKFDHFLFTAHPVAMSFIILDEFMFEERTDLTYKIRLATKAGIGYYGQAMVAEQDIQKIAAQAKCCGIISEFHENVPRVRIDGVKLHGLILVKVCVKVQFFTEYACFVCFRCFWAPPMQHHAES